MRRVAGVRWPLGGDRQSEAGMAQALSDVERVLKLIERVRLLVAIDDDMPVERKLNTQPVLKLLEAAVASEDRSDQQRASGYYSMVYGELSEYPDLEALLSAMRVFLPYL
jgi:hypothetical protein